jgi:hypothetical protein
VQQSIGSAACDSCLGTSFGASKRALRGRGSHSNDQDFSENFFCACARQQRGTYRKLMLALVDGRSHSASQFPQEARFRFWVCLCRGSPDVNRQTDRQKFYYRITNVCWTRDGFHSPLSCFVTGGVSWEDGASCEPDPPGKIGFRGAERQPPGAPAHPPEVLIPPAKDLLMPCSRHTTSLSAAPPAAGGACRCVIAAP